ncbi:hypothetical protein I3842_06G064200 [Carya illinoinensis]|uniref:Uncharacterized protein n=1 Tax=Carya illinoinensis TaxID=32201 RepID=A0A922EUI1_CARIL|nr:hypothetical protein I3842_06G064200 [Carya illinoinensis]
MSQCLKDFFTMGVDSMATWITNDWADLEFEVRERQKVAFYAKQEISHLLAEETELESYLKQADGHIHFLEGKLDILYEDVFELQGELLHVGSTCWVFECQARLCPTGRVLA